MDTKLLRIEKKKRKNISAALKRDVWLKYVGNKAKIKCFCCNVNEIYFCSGVHNTWQAGHVISDYNGGKAEINNLLPICKYCNNTMSDENWDDYVDRHPGYKHSLDYSLENYYKKYEKGIKLWQSLWRHYLLRKRKYMWRKLLNIRTRNF